MADERSGTIGRVTVVAVTHRCGCLVARTLEGYLAEAAFCAEALPIERERLALQTEQRRTEMDDPAMDELIPALEGGEEDLEAHRRSAGVAERVVRTSDPALLPGEVPVSAAEVKETARRTA
jgi:hypothetical protein